MANTPFVTERNFFENLSAEMQAAVRSHARPVRYSDGVMIHQRGDAANALSLIQAGRVRMSNVSTSGDRITTAELRAGESFGLFPLLAGQLRSHDAHACSDVDLLEISKPAFQRLLDEAPDLRDHIISHLASRLVRALEAVEDARRFPLKIRLAKLLLQRAGHSGVIKATQSALADELGVSRYGLGLALKTYVSGGLVKTDYGSVTLLDQSRLQRIVEKSV